MLSDLERKPISQCLIFSKEVGNYSERLLKAIEAECNGVCEDRRTNKIQTLANSIMTAYELGLRDGKLECVAQIKTLFFTPCRKEIR